MSVRLFGWGRGTVNLCWVSPAPATADAAGEHENGRGSRTSIVSTEASVVLVSLVSPWPASMIDASENNSRSTAANIYWEVAARANDC